MRRIFLIIALLAITWPLITTAQEGIDVPEDVEEGYNVNFINRDLEAFVELVAKATRKRILYDASLKGRKIFLVSPSPVPENKLFKIFLSVMEYNNFIIERNGVGDNEVIKIKRNIQGPWTPTRTIFTEDELGELESRDDFISMVIKLRYISAREVQTTLRALRIVNPQGGNLAGIEGSNTILVTDYAPNVKRIYDVIRLMDQQGPEKQFRIFRLRSARAEELVETLGEFAVTKARSGGIGLGPNLHEIKLVADSRLNALIVQAYPAKMERISSLINELDEALELEPSRIHYIRLKHADAQKTQETLAKLLEGGGIGGGSKTPSTSKRVSSGVKGPDAPSVEADLQNNALLVKAEQRDWDEIREIIEQIDVRRPQVLIEAAILEISPQDLLGLGVEVFFAEEADDGTLNLGGGSNFGFSNLVTVNNDVATPLNGDGNQNVVGQKFGKLPAIRGDFARSGILFGQYDDIFTLPILVNAIQTRADTKVVSMPRVVTNDNEQAELKVADAQPSEVNERDNSGNNRISFGDFQEAGTTLLITPHISGEKNYLRLDISQTIEAFDVASAAVGGVQAKTVRQLTTTVTIPDGQTVAIGGLSSDVRSVAVEKIPLLGDLPIIGFLFQTRIVTHKEQNIYLFVTPHILRDESFKDFIKISHDEKLDAQKYGVDVGLFDKSFIRYQEKYGRNKEDEPAPFYMLRSGKDKK